MFPAIVVIAAIVGTTYGILPLLEVLMNPYWDCYSSQTVSVSATWSSGNPTIWIVAVLGLVAIYLTYEWAVKPCLVKEKEEGDKK